MDKLYVGAPIYKAAEVSGETRPQLLHARTNSLLARLQKINTKANEVALTLTGQSVLGPSPEQNEPQNLGLYTNLFTALDRCEDVCAEIEKSLEEVIR